ncbi:MAG: lysine--tRNA ligase [Chloroflexi bacterium]|nr:lysine--tRNA ligase [Chloroflexota bacterium]HEV8053652.1 lysine--tRNA ligase [Candidatus Limnocylindrales bacterium]
MYWADELAAAASGPQVVNDSKTPSGTVHVGSLRGVVLHDAIWRALRERGTQVEFRYGVEDLDPMDAQALLTPDAIGRFMGMPLAHIPAPEGSEAPNYARHFAGLFLQTFAGLGVRPELYWMSEQYASGAMDPYVERALAGADTIRRIYRTVSTVRHAEGWLPIHVICENCGRVGTTIATDWDGSEVSYACRPDLVDWATGCDHAGRIDPRGGRAKLVWNVEWAARWGLLGVTIEGCGKDLATKGGSRDRADAVSREIFEREPPRNVPYEFLNIGGRKMSTSRGEGAAAHEMADLLPPELLRFLFVRHRPNKHLEFDPGGDTVPGLFDEYDRIAEAAAGVAVRGELPPNPEAIFRASLVDPDADPPLEAGRFRPPFRHLALLVQVPGADLGERMAAEKGAPLDAAELAILEGRAAVATSWLADFAPDRYRIQVRRDELPAEASDLTSEQRDYLAALASGAAREEPVAGDQWQDLIFRTAADKTLPSGDAFGALYRAFLGRENGPRAGWLLASLPPDFVLDRLRDAALTVPPAAPMPGEAAPAPGGSA